MIKFAKIPCDRTFSDTLLPKIMNNLEEVIALKLQEAHCVCIISDIWTTKNMHDFLAISANIMSKNFKRETVVIGMVKMPGNHNAEHIKEAIEQIINSFEFNKEKVNASVSDEAAAYVRLFKQLRLTIQALNNETITIENQEKASTSIHAQSNNDQILSDEDFDSEQQVIEDWDLMCFENQVQNELLNYDFADNEFEIDDNCERNSNLINVDREIDEAWTDIRSVPINSPVNIAQTASIPLTDDILAFLDLVNENDEYEELRNRPLTEILIEIGKLKK